MTADNQQNRLGDLGLASEVLDRDGILAIDAGQWHALSAAALDDNPFYARSYVLAGMATLDRRVALRALAVRRVDDGVLVGLFPFTLRRFPLARAAAAGNLYQFCGLPLIDRTHGAAVVAAWFAAMDQGSVPRQWRFGDLDLSSNFAALCRATKGEAELQFVPTGTYERARLVRGDGGFDSHVAAVISKSRARDIQRTLRRLGELGTLRFERASAPDAVAARLEDYLTLEQAGWKGAGGTAFLSRPDHADFARLAFARDAGSLVSIDSLVLDEKPIALSINLQTGDTMFTPKCTYDEDYRRYSPGLALEYLVIEAFYTREDCREMDAATTVNGHVVAGLWNCAKPMGTLMVGPRHWTTSARVQVRQALREGKAALKAAPQAVAGLARQGRQQVVRARSAVVLSALFIGDAVDNLAKISLGV